MCARALLGVQFPDLSGHLFSTSGEPSFVWGWSIFMNARALFVGLCNLEVCSFYTEKQIPSYLISDALLAKIFCFSW
jgi:hypothetical protein